MSLKNELNAIPETALVATWHHLNDRSKAPDPQDFLKQVHETSPALGMYIDQFVMDRSGVRTYDPETFPEDQFKCLVAIGQLCMTLCEYAELNDVLLTIGHLDIMEPDVTNS